MFARFGSWCVRRRRLVVAAWILALVTANVAAQVVGPNFGAEPEIPASDSASGFTVFEEEFGGVGAGFSGQIVFAAEAGVTEQGIESAMSDLFDEVSDIEGVASVQSPYEPLGASQVNPAGDLAYAVVDLDADVDQFTSAEIGGEIADAVPEIEGLQVEIGGEEFVEFEPPESELIGLAFAIVVLIISFGSVLAMGLPIGVAIAGVGTGLAFSTFLSHVMPVPDFVTTLGAMIGLGVGIDYALFIVTRYRDGLHQGLSTEDAVARAMDTSGRAVLFAGVTVVISLLGMIAMNLSFITGLAVGTSITVAVTLIASLTLLPALLGFAGDRVEVTRRGGLLAAGLVALGLAGVGLGVPQLVYALAAGFVVALISRFIPALRVPLAPRRAKPIRDTVWYRWSRIIQHHPWAAALGTTALLLVMSIPVFSLRLGFPDEGNFPAGSTTREAYDLLAEGFGPGVNGPLALVAEVDSPEEIAAMTSLAEVLVETEGVAQVSPAFPNDFENPTAVAIQVTPETSPQDLETEELVRRLRDEVVPTSTPDGLDVFVAGGVAAGMDFSSYMSSRMGIFFGGVLTLSFLLLMVVFRSLLVPLKAVVMNMLSIAAAYGVVVAVFQWGWLGSWVGIEQTGPIEPFIPMMLFAIVFGLSMDYEVFLLSRMKEEFERTGNAAESVADGLAATARVITAAAAIMVVVFGSFVLEDLRTIKLFGLGLAVAVFLDATLVRMLLVPATMELLGERNWWMPAWLDRILPQLNVEGTHEAHMANASVEAEQSAAEDTDDDGTGEGHQGGGGSDGGGGGLGRPDSSGPKPTAPEERTPIRV